MDYAPRTKHGYNLYDMSSMLQKAIRRGDLNHAGYAANEMYGNYEKYVWKRLLVISAEDCYGIMTKEIIGLKMASDIVNAGKKGDDKDLIFVAKAITLLCMARKNRDGCYVACNFMYPDRILEPDEIPHINITECDLDDGVPAWVYDVHTLKGRKMGKTDHDMTISEQECLNPLQLNLFDNAGWNNYYRQERARGNIRSDAEWKRIVDFMYSRENDPTHDGEDFPYHAENWSEIKDTERIEYPKK